MASENDVVLIHLEDTPVSFARVEEILPDVKKDWYHIKLLMLQVPLQVVTWILKGDYINGAEFFMGGKRMRLEKVVCPDSARQTDDAPDQEKKDDPSREPGPDSPPETTGREPGKGKVISFADVKRSRKTDGKGR